MKYFISHYYLNSVCLRVGIVLVVAVQSTVTGEQTILHHLNVLLENQVRENFKNFVLWFLKSYL